MIAAENSAIDVRAKASEPSNPVEILNQGQIVSFGMVGSGVNAFAGAMLRVRNFGVIEGEGSILGQDENDFLRNFGTLHGEVAHRGGDDFCAMAA